MHNIEISQNAFEYLQSQAQPFVDSPALVLDRIIIEHKIINKNKTNDSIVEEPYYRASDFPDVTHTSIEIVIVKNKTESMKE